MLPNGHILIFDNGTHRKASRVVELDPVTKRVVWRYPRKDNPNFFSAWRGNAQRLDNGNTLICEAEKGHSFEITPEGKTVWEFWSPFFNSKGQRLRVYRMMRISIDPSKFATGKPVPIENIPAPIDRPQP
jgi:hypothetical protein